MEVWDWLEARGCGSIQDENAIRVLLAGIGYALKLSADRAFASFHVAIQQKFSARCSSHRTNNGSRGPDQQSTPVLSKSLRHGTASRRDTQSGSLSLGTRSEASPRSCFRVRGISQFPCLDVQPDLWFHDRQHMFGLGRPSTTGP